MLALLLQRAAPSQLTVLQELQARFGLYLAGDLVLAVLVGVVFYKLLRPAVLRNLPIQRSKALRLMLAGALAALLPLGLTVLAGLASGSYSPQTPGYALYEPLTLGSTAATGGQIWLFFAVQSCFEELLFRGVGLALLATLLAWLARTVLARDQAADATVLAAGRMWFASGLAANLVVSGAFGYIHHNNPHVSLFAVANIALAGFALGQLFWLQRNLWGACAMHTVWNAALATFGLPVSGLVARGPLLGNIRGSVDNLITGGSFGPEASAVTTAGLLLVSAWLVWRCHLAAAAAEAALQEERRIRYVDPLPPPDRTDAGR